MKESFLTQLEHITDSTCIHVQEPMSRHTTFRVGGPADVLVTPDRDSIAAIIKLCRSENVPYTLIGNGSNLLVSDKGVRGVVIKMGEHAGEIRVTQNEITAQAGALLSKIANTAAKEGLAGMEFAAGIPGSLGGAVVMNAGAYGGEMKDILVNAVVLDENGEEKTLSADELELRYRHSCISEKHYIVLEATIRLQSGDEQEIRLKMKELSEQRQEKQPLQYPSAGSTFKRPEGYFAGKLIMDAGLRGYTVGGAQVSEKHCGFVINKGDATAEDICKLMKDVSEKVQEQFGVVLEPEVKQIGEF